MNKEICPHCGSTISPRKENLSRGIIKTLIKFRGAVVIKGENKVHPRKEMELSKSEYNNFQKLRYHALIAKCKKEGTGYWLLTRRGGQFLNGLIEIPKTVHILNNRIVGKEDNLVSIKDVMKDRGVPYFPEIHDIEYVSGHEFDDKPTEKPYKMVIGEDNIARKVYETK